MTIIVTCIVLILLMAVFTSANTVCDVEKSKFWLSVVNIILGGMFVFVIIASRGIFGNPISLDSKEYYRILSVTVVDEKSTVVILKDGKDVAVPIKFSYHPKSNTNGLYTLGGSGWHDYRLIKVE